MGELFSCFLKEPIITNNIAQWAEILDWLLDDGKFKPESGWNPNYNSSLTTKVKDSVYIKKYLTKYKPQKLKDLNFNIPKRKANTYIYFKKSSESVSLITHIRNSIAHGLANLVPKSNVLYIEILDFDYKGAQTAYMFFPIHLICCIYEEYNKIKDKIAKANHHK